MGEYLGSYIVFLRHKQNLKSRNSIQKILHTKKQHYRSKSLSELKRYNKHDRLDAKELAIFNEVLMELEPALSTNVFYGSKKAKTATIGKKRTREEVCLLYVCYRFIGGKKYL